MERSLMSCASAAPSDATKQKARKPSKSLARVLMAFLSGVFVGGLSHPSGGTISKAPRRSDGSSRGKISQHVLVNALVLQPGFVRCLGTEVSSHDACKRCPSLGRSVG